MRRGRVKRRLQKQMIKKLWEGFRFDPQVDRVV
jgi:hypothetical protein